MYLLNILCKLDHGCIDMVIISTCATYLANPVVSECQTARNQRKMPNSGAPEIVQVESGSQSGLQAWAGSE